MTDATAAPDAALARRLRDDPEAARRLDDLRRVAYGRGGSAAPLVEVPAALRERTGYADRELPAPLVALLEEEARLVDEGAALLAAERPAPGPPDGSAATAGTRTHGVYAAADADADAAAPPTPSPARRRAAITASVAGLLVLAGLGAASAAGVLDLGAPAAPEAAAGASDSRGSAPGTATPRGQAMGTPDGRRGAPLPDFTADPPVPVPPTEEEIAEELRIRADQSWELVLTQEPDAVRPDVRAERIVDQEEYAETQVDCLRAAGVDAQLSGRDSYGITDPDHVAVHVCEVRFPMRPDVPRSDAELAYLHDYYASFLLPCYRAEGASDIGELPEVDEFIALARAQRPWSPFPARMSGRLSAACPELPAAFR
ncbi:hypothetical protein [Clavibacter zhangzhiyongii]|uniref:Uncharacterized protein n=1 Tax=Clavibacter zhangzhiyongii TaxID=2768071 RepID=A0A7L7Z0K3_9MICO|nr:hypothetical protein [Clavibacter zhangzhiyongii]QOD43243.1 hypothetical protein H9X71_11610 [Clavibacter zhangzhiyongii]